MKRKTESLNIFKIITVIIFICFSVTTVHAETCDALLTPEAADFISDIMSYVRIGIPILLVVLCAGDFVGVVTSQDEAAIKKAGSRVIKRFIAAAAVFFVPLIVTVILGIPAIKNSLNLVDDPTCGITTDE